ncbi:LAMI_0H16732g1_1 [Lachancea mirantina]|uniref:LAMI_0H16732g1_1 n=1 Tax=Lachancea mirantina TaxID=1230905 RepID=A0A1G4KIX7_9SACH|nr:LAMI_0H16732g1_1 [Lachancea mirantina]
MNRPELPPKGSFKEEQTSSSRNPVYVELPKDIQRFPSSATEELISENRKHLENFVLRFNDTEDCSGTVRQCKQDLETVLKEFKELGQERQELELVMGKMATSKEEYVTKSQQLEDLMEAQFDMRALLRSFEAQLSDMNSTSRFSEQKRCDDIDAFLEGYLKSRTKYHLSRLKVDTWKAGYVSK